MRRMTNYILISRTFCEATPESCENGDFSKTRFIARRIKVTFTELVDLMKEHTIPSQSPHNGNIDVSFSTDWFTSNYTTYTTREESIHFHRQNASNAAKYWKLAAKAAIKGNQLNTL